MRALLARRFQAKYFDILNIFGKKFGAKFALFVPVRTHRQKM